MKQIAGQMAFQQLNSSISLSDYIHSFWYTERLFSAEQPYFDILPDGFVELIFFYDATCGQEKADGTYIPLSSPFIVGLLDKPVRLKIFGPVRVLAVRGYPWMLFPLIGLLPQTNDQLQVNDNRLRHLSEHLKSALKDDPMEALEELRRCCEEEFKPLPKPDQLLHLAGLAVMRQNGAGRISDLAKEYNMTQKTVERKFKKTSGNSAKALARKVRFEKVRNYLWFNPECSLSSVAFEFGFTDQAHLSREFRSFSGQMPSVFIRAAGKAKQMLPQNVEIIQV